MFLAYTEAHDEDGTVREYDFQGCEGLADLDGLTAGRSVKIYRSSMGSDRATQYYRVEIEVE
jgi:hypothetical protein